MNIRHEIQNGCIVFTWNPELSDVKLSGFKVVINDCTEKWIDMGSVNEYAIWQAADNIIKIEAETFHPKGWVFNNELNGYSGKGYLINQQNFNTGKEEMSASEAKKIPIENQFAIIFQVKEAGYYRMDTKWAADNSEANDLWLRFTDSDQSYHKIGRIIKENQKEKFLFNSWNMKEMYLEPGFYSAFCAPRSPNLCLDYIVIHKVTEATTSDTSELAKKKYGYWLINAISDKDLQLVSQSAHSQPLANSFGIMLSGLCELNMPLKITILPVSENQNQKFQTSEILIKQPEEHNN